jgi:hypothetical protein
MLVIIVPSAIGALFGYTVGRALDDSTNTLPEAKRNSKELVRARKKESACARICRTSGKGFMVAGHLLTILGGIATGAGSVKESKTFSYYKECPLFEIGINCTAIGLWTMAMGTALRSFGDKSTLKYFNTPKVIKV